MVENTSPGSEASTTASGSTDDAPRRTDAKQENIPEVITRTHFHRKNPPLILFEQQRTQKQTPPRADELHPNSPARQTLRKTRGIAYRSTRDWLCGELKGRRINGSKGFLTKHLLRDLLESELDDDGKPKRLPPKVVRKLFRMNLQGYITPDIAAMAPIISPPVGSQKPSYRKILAILLLILQSSKIGSIIVGGVCDDDLPLRTLEIPSLQQRSGVLQLAKKDSEMEPLQCFVDWDQCERNDFYKWQWAVLAPKFECAEGKDIHEYEFADEEILPYTLWKKVANEGGSGQVYMAEIHHEHHSFESSHDASSTHIFAVKELRKTEDEAIRKLMFRREVAILKSLNHGDHRKKHLISLLAAYRHGDTYGLIFPWAQCDLLEYWKTQRSGLLPAERKATLAWLAEQCLGIAHGLYAISRYTTDRGKTLMTIRPPLSLTYRSDNGKNIELYGRHADIKPQNILWFPGPKGGSDLDARGTLKIADFGIADFRVEETAERRLLIADAGAELAEEKGAPVRAAGSLTKQTKSTTQMSYRRHRIPNSPGYRPPECDVVNGQIGPLYDIWALGCVYLEFLTWWVGGWGLVKKFAERRVAPDPELFGRQGPNFESDRFFTFEGKTDEEPVVKRSVTEVSDQPESRLSALGHPDLVS